MAIPNKIDADWLTFPETVAVMRALNTADPGCARFVGGCIRNTLRGAPVDDIDIATQLTPDEVMSALNATGIRHIATGLEHGTITAIVDGHPFEITTLRRDVETDGRRAVVAFTRDWELDAARRDFRLNAIYADADGNLFEFVEHSIRDAIAGYVAFIGDPDERLREDYLRILRFFRFNAWYGQQLDTDGFKACSRQKEGLLKIAPERIWKELKKTAAAPNPRDGLLAMDGSGVLALLAGGGRADELGYLMDAEQMARREIDPLVRIMAILPRSREALQAFCERMKVSNEEHRRLTAWFDPGLGHLLAYGKRKARSELKQVLYTHGAQAVCDRVLVDSATKRDDGLAARYVCGLAGRWERPTFPIGGDDALAAGLKGPEVGKALRRVETRWIQSHFKLEREALLKLLTSPDSSPRRHH